MSVRYERRALLELLPWPTALELLEGCPHLQTGQTNGKAEGLLGQAVKIQESHDVCCCLLLLDEKLW